MNHTQSIEIYSRYQIKADAVYIDARHTPCHPHFARPEYNPALDSRHDI